MSSVEYATTAQDSVVTLTNANQEYTLAIPDGTKAIEFQARTAADIRHAMAIGKVATPTDPYRTLKSGGVYSKGMLYITKGTLYFASGSAGTVVEVRFWL